MGSRSASGDSLSAIEPFLGELIEAVKPAQRKRLVEKLMQLSRRANAQRIAANETPDRGAMAPRKKREACRAETKRGRMFKRIGKTSSLKIRASPYEGELRFDNSLVEATAAVHHYGQEGFVGRSRRGKVVRTKYQARALLGFGREQEQFLDEMLKHLSGKT
jgi:phage virion morphogenesis protein